MMQFFCTLGLHSWYMDVTLFGCVRRCNNCSASDNPYIARRMERAAEIFRSLPEVGPSENRVYLALAKADAEELYR